MFDLQKVSDFLNNYPDLWKTLRNFATTLGTFVFQIYQFRVKGLAATTSQALRRFDDDANSTPPESHIMTHASSVLKESKTSFTSKATQTDCDDPGSAGRFQLNIKYTIIQKKGKATRLT